MAYKVTPTEIQSKWSDSKPNNLFKIREFGLDLKIYLVAEFGYMGCQFSAMEFDLSETITFKQRRMPRSIARYN